MESINPMEFPFNSMSKIYDDHTIATDLDGSAMNLCEGRYEMASHVVSVRIRKGKDVNKENYDLLRSFHHGCAIPLLDMYCPHGKKQCLVIPAVDGSFKGWFNIKGHSLLFDSNGHMTGLLQHMIVEFADLISSLHQRLLVLENFTMDNIYVIAPEGSPPMIYILLLEVKLVNVIGAVDKGRNFGYVREFLTWCEKACKVERDEKTQSFCDFIGSNLFTTEKLKYYPHNWDWEMKGQYLILLVYGDKGLIRRKLQGLSWPFQHSHRVFDSLPKIIRDLVDWNEAQTKSVGTNTSDFFEYVTLLRHCFKHYDDIPKHIQDLLGCQQAFIEMIEHITPRFWIIVYERIGWP